MRNAHRQALSDRIIEHGPELSHPSQALPEEARRDWAPSAEATHSPRISPVVAAANTLTARWCASQSDDDFVISGAGVWPLLALLASAADEPASTELAEAIERPSDSAQRDALELVDILRSGSSTNAAVGIWTRNGIPLRDGWTSQLPEGVFGQLTRQAPLDQWAADQTDGLIRRFPVDITPESKLVMASALATRVQWRTPFDSYPLKRHDDDGDAPEQQWLDRTTPDITTAAVLDGSVTRVVVEGDGDVDVHLLVGPLPAGDVLSAGLRELAGEALVDLASDFVGVAPGLTVKEVQASTPENQLRLRLPAFDINSRHDLLDYSDLFGLQSVTNPATSHLPLLSAVPLCVTRGAQSVLARFYSGGFEAAAVSAFDLMLTGAPSPDRYAITVAEVSFERPFGFLAVHRPSRLAVVAGWVCSPFDSSTVCSEVDLPSNYKGGLSKAVIEELKTKGYNQSQIAAMFGVTRQAVSWHLKTYDAQLSPRQIVNKSWPWQTTSGHGKSVPCRRLRDHGEYMATSGKGMSPDALKRLRSWWRKLDDENLVVEFDPNLPPLAGLSPHGGFAYRARQGYDADLLIRVNEHTRLTEEGARIWCWPIDFPRKQS